ncbi:MAG: hypothetical protein Q3971_07310 [Moraxella sp.]|nr:hypothetical protein [Moraxella sp.]
MLRVVDGGVSITLNGKDANPLFVMAGVLVALAVCVAVVAMIAPTEVTIGVMTLLAVLIFVFNVYKNRLQTQSHINSGQITIKNRAFIAGGQTVRLTPNATIELVGKTLLIKDLGRSWHIGGFDDDKERHVAKSVLEGKALEKREQAIRLM